MDAKRVLQWADFACIGLKVVGSNIVAMGPGRSAEEWARFLAAAAKAEIIVALAADPEGARVRASAYFTATV